MSMMFHDVLLICKDPVDVMEKISENFWMGDRKKFDWRTATPSESSLGA